MSVREFLKNVLDNQLAWALGSVFGLGAALLDLRSTTRWPYLFAVCGLALLLTLLWPKWAWRWVLLAALSENSQKAALRTASNELTSHKHRAPSRCF